MASLFGLKIIAPVNLFTAAGCSKNQIEVSCDSSVCEALI